MAGQPGKPASWGIYAEPVCAAEYGDQDSGKSTDLLKTFCNALYIAGPGGLKIGTSVLGFDPGPRTIRVNDLEQAIAEILNIPAILEARPDLAACIDSVYVDDVTPLAEATFANLEIKYPARKDTGARYGECFEQVRLLGYWIRRIGLHAGMSFHMRGPELAKEKGKMVFYRGGVELPSRKLINKFQRVVDVVMRCGEEPGRIPWKGVFLHDAEDPDFETKDRHDVLGTNFTVGPQNMRELLNAGGYAMSRLPGLEWQEAVADWICERRAAGMDRREAWNAGRDKLGKGNLNPLHIRWALQDGLDRYDYQKIKARGVLDCFDIAAERPVAAVNGGGLGSLSGGLGATPPLGSPSVTTATPATSTLGSPASPSTATTLAPSTLGAPASSTAQSGTLAQ